MSELSFMGKLMKAMELSKAAHTGLTLTYFDVIELSGEIEALKGYIAELEEKQRWRVVANGELPEDGEVVWLWDGKYIGMGYYLVFAGQFMDRDTPLRRIKPTHWMPLPESPNDTQTQTIVYGKEREE